MELERGGGVRIRGAQRPYQSHASSHMSCNLAQKVRIQVKMTIDANFSAMNSGRDAKGKRESTFELARQYNHRRYTSFAPASSHMTRSSGVCCSIIRDRHGANVY